MSDIIIGLTLDRMSFVIELYLKVLLLTLQTVVLHSLWHCGDTYRGFQHDREAKLLLADYQTIMT